MREARKCAGDVCAGGAIVEVKAEGLWDVRERLRENLVRVEAALKQIEQEGDKKLGLAAAAELRQHIVMAERALETTISADAQRIFEETVLKVMDEAGPELRKRIVALLNERAGEAGR